MIVVNSLQFYLKLPIILDLALMETASFTAGFRQERYSVQQEKASKNTTIARLLLKIVCLMFKSSIFALWKQIDRKK
jgi:hypothetical protein